MLHINPEPLPPPPSGFVHISNVSDGRDDAPLDKRYKAGQAVRARVIGFRLVDGLATLSMKKSVLDQQVCVCGGGMVHGRIKLRAFFSYVHIQPSDTLSATVALPLTFPHFPPPKHSSSAIRTSSPASLSPPPLPPSRTTACWSRRDPGSRGWSPGCTPQTSALPRPCSSSRWGRGRRGAEGEAAGSTEGVKRIVPRPHGSDHGSGKALLTIWVGGEERGGGGAEKLCLVAGQS